MKRAIRFLLSIMGGGILAVLGGGCGASNYAQRDDVDALQKELRQQREQQVLIERRIADMDSRLSLLANRLAEARPPAPVPSASSGRPALDVVRLQPTQPRVERRSEPSSLQALDAGDAVATDDGQDTLSVPVDRQVLADSAHPRADRRAAEEQETLARTDPRTQYDLAMRQFKARGFAEAARGFEEVADRWPDHPLADNAVYWTGVCYLQQNEMALAINELQKVPVRYPKSDKVPDALLQLAEAYLRVGDKESAKAMLTQVVEMFPSAEAAGPARESLARLSQP
jgi:tol-pal system protein YbgF